MLNAIADLISDYAGLILAWPVMIWTVALIAKRRYGTYMARDMVKIVKPLSGLICLAVPVLADIAVLTLPVLVVYLITESRHQAAIRYGESIASDLNRVLPWIIALSMPVMLACAAQPMVGVILFAAWAALIEYQRKQRLEQCEEEAREVEERQHFLRQHLNSDNNPFRR